ncbi:MAG: hypothetical protein Q7U04_07290 [Bacteriovorax sp.]|nr:hypothetical protein [Bacteriovorax sp.]
MVSSLLEDYFIDFSVVYTIRIDGARRNKVEEPLTTGTLYPIQWRELRVNLAELAKLRYIDGWSRKQLAEHYGRTEMAIQNYFQNIKKKGFNLSG